MSRFRNRGKKTVLESRLLDMATKLPYNLSKVQKVLLRRFVCGLFLCRMSDITRWAHEN